MAGGLAPDLPSKARAGERCLVERPLVKETEKHSCKDFQRDGDVQKLSSALMRARISDPEAELCYKGGSIGKRRTKSQKRRRKEY
jgi:hypothetical protein